MYYYLAEANKRVVFWRVVVPNLERKASRGELTDYRFAAGTITNHLNRNLIKNNNIFTKKSK